MVDPSPGCFSSKQQTNDDKIDCHQMSFHAFLLAQLHFSESPMEARTSATHSDHSRESDEQLANSRPATNLLRVWVTETRREVHVFTVDKCLWKAYVDSCAHIHAVEVEGKLIQKG